MIQFFKICRWQLVLRYYLLALSLMFFCVGKSLASEVSDRRLEIGLSLFPRVLAVDTQFHNKLTPQNTARLAFIYVNDKGKATSLAESLMNSKPIIAKVSVETVAVSVDELDGQSSQKYTGMFITEKLSQQDVERVIHYSTSNGIILFSSFSGDVERGVSIGLLITSRVWPYLNVQMINKAGIQLNELLVKISKRYE
jgi:hypothetical protein